MEGVGFALGLGSRGSGAGNSLGQVFVIGALGPGFGSTRCLVPAGARGDGIEVVVGRLGLRPDLATNGSAWLRRGGVGKGVPANGPVNLDPVRIVEEGRLAVDDDWLFPGSAGLDNTLGPGGFLGEQLLERDGGGWERPARC